MVSAVLSNTLVKKKVYFLDKESRSKGRKFHAQGLQQSTGRESSLTTRL